MDKFLEFREKYPEFIFDNFLVEETINEYIITFHYIIPSLTDFNHQIKIKKSQITNNNLKSNIKEDNLFIYIVFNIGLVELISYYKTVCSPRIIINCGYLNNEQILWFKKLIFNGLGELLYKNSIHTNINDLVEIISNVQEKPVFNTNYIPCGNLIPVGGGKDSCVTLEILKNEANNTCFMINGKEPQIGCAYSAGYSDNQIFFIERKLDQKIIDLNNKGFINGHIPFSSVVAFISYLAAYLTNKKDIVLSNESSANESTVIGLEVNHQYSKSYEFEKNFNDYIHKYFKIDISYYSLLRPLSEFQIGYLFSKYKKYHPIFKSCNLGSKSTPWKWCCDCPKCLFVYIILSPHLYKDDLINIFSEDLFEKSSLLNYFKEIIGEAEVKPFECVGTIKEANYALSLLINKLDKTNLPYLLKYYYENHKLDLDPKDILSLNKENNLNEKVYNLLLGELDND